MQRSTLGQLEGCNWIGFCDWIYFFCQSSLSNAVALASLFFLFSVGSLINAIEVIFLLAWLSSLTQGTLWKRSPCFFSLSLSSILLLILPHNQMTKILGFCFFRDTSHHTPVRYGQERLLQSEVCQFLTSWTCCELLWRVVPFFKKKFPPKNWGHRRLALDMLVSPSNQTSLPKNLTTPPHLFHPRRALLVWPRNLRLYRKWGRLCGS